MSDPLKSDHLLKLYWGGKTESQLAAFQRRQQGNTCGVHSCAAALRMLFSVDIDANWAVALLNQNLSFWARLRYLTPLGGGMYPFQQTAFLNDLAFSKALPLSTRVCSGTMTRLKIGLANRKDQCLILDLAWFWDPPGIYYGHNAIGGKISRRLLGAHAMVLAAFDESHRDKSGVFRPWGFINSWHQNSGNANEIGYLHWMSTQDFIRSWRFAGRRMVMVERNAD